MQKFMPVRSISNWCETGRYFIYEKAENFCKNAKIRSEKNKTPDGMQQAKFCQAFAIDGNQVQMVSKTEAIDT
ncbi:hypothetical protein C2857_003398 [Epichloe festucae Fl1]|uniref:Uncharacterized protein n=1 Tax=Epichloe festucae (strain Fl1) TaxID=877507 RepID=A0A7S9KNU3_EPIFF|nr:hypothetical protein C2857_003398 [Epichloe festucae Fl1]